MYGYDRRNKRILKEAALVAHRTMLVEAEKEKYKQHHAEQARLANMPHDGMTKESIWLSDNTHILTA